MIHLVLMLILIAIAAPFVARWVLVVLLVVAGLIIEVGIVVLLFTTGAPPIAFVVVIGFGAVVCLCIERSTKAPPR